MDGGTYLNTPMLSLLVQKCYKQEVVVQKNNSKSVWPLAILHHGEKLGGCLFYIVTDILR